MATPLWAFGRGATRGTPRKSREKSPAPRTPSKRKEMPPVATTKLARSSEVSEASTAYSITRAESTLGPWEANNTYDRLSRTAGLKRDASLIIPSMISTQEVLQNLSRYRRSGSENSDLDEEQVILGRGNPFVANTTEASPIISSPSFEATLSPAAVPLPLHVPQIPPSSPSQIASSGGKIVTAADTKMRVDEDEDSDLIMDFEDSDGEQDCGGPNRNDITNSVLQGSFSLPPSTRSSPRQQSQSPAHIAGRLRSLGMASPQSPSRRFIIPTALPGARDNLEGPPDSPTKRLRPLSELPRPVAPPALLAPQSPSRRGAGMSGSPRKRGTSRVQLTTARTSTALQTELDGRRNITGIAALSRVLQKPPALGPLLQKIADETRSEQLHLRKDTEAEASRKRRRLAKGKERADSGQTPPAEAELDQPALSLYNGLSPPPILSPLEPEPKAQVQVESRRGLRMTSWPSTISLPSTSAPKDTELKKQALLAEVEAMRTPLSLSSPTMIAVSRMKREEPLSQRPNMPDTTPNGKPATYAQSSLTGISNQTALNSGQQSVATTPLEPQPQPEQPQQRQKPAQLEGQMEKQLSNAIPLPSLVIQFAPKLTPIDVIKWPPEKTGRFHILVLVISIGAADKVVTKEQQRVISKCELTVCDQSATSFKLNLWSNSCEWVEKQMFRAGDALLITDVRVKGYRQQTTRGAVEKISGGTSWWSRMVKLDGSLLSLYRGHIEVESHLSVLAKKRRILALDLLDKEKGIANDGSFYITQPMCSLSTQPKFPVVSVGAGLLSSASSRDAGRPQRAAMGTHISGLMTLLSTGSKTANDLPANLPATPGALTTLKSILPTHITGTSIRACVVYRMLITAGDESQGWEVGAVMPNGRFVRIQSQHAASWIQDASPGRVLHFFGKFREKSDLFHIDGISREPYLLHDNAWAETIKNVQPRQFRSIRSMHEHKFMGDAILDAHIMAVSFPDLVDDNGEASYDSDMFGFIRCYCTGCYSIAVTSPQNPAILLCRECHSDPQKSRRPLEWMYPTFELSLADKPRLAANLASESLQVRCQLEVGDQVFMSVPARRWMQDEEGFWISRGRWRKLMELMNKQGECADEGRGTEDEVSAAAGGEGGGDDVAQRIRVEMRVGVNMVAKALRVAYL